MSTEVVIGRMRLTDYLACLFGFFLFFTLAGGCLGFLLAVYFGFTNLMYLCLLVSSTVGLALGTVAVIFLKISNRQLNSTYSTAVNTQKVIAETVIKTNGWNKGDYYRVLLVCLAIGVGVGLYFGMFFGEMTGFRVSVSYCSLIGLEFGLVVGFVMLKIHHSNNLQHLYQFPKAQARLRNNFSKWK